MFNIFSFNILAYNILKYRASKEPTGLFIIKCAIYTLLIMFVLGIFSHFFSKSVYKFINYVRRYKLPIVTNKEISNRIFKFKYISKKILFCKKYNLNFITYRI